jgi:molecular chaperone GrpE
MTHNEDPTPSPSSDEELNIGDDRQSLDLADDDVTDISLADSTLQLEADLAATKVDVAEWRDRYMRKAAEFENYRKRVEKEKSDLRILAQSTILQGILPVVDGFDRALQYFGSEQESTASSASQYREGVELLHRQVLDTLVQAGATPIETKGQVFDPNLHEAISREETAAVEDGTIVRELRRGYMFKDRLLRPAQVIVAVHPKNPES